MMILTSNKSQVWQDNDTLHIVVVFYVFKRVFPMTFNMILAITKQSTIHSSFFHGTHNFTTVFPDDCLNNTSRCEK